MKRIAIACYFTLLLAPFTQPELTVAGDQPSDFIRPRFKFPDRQQTTRLSLIGPYMQTYPRLPMKPGYCPSAALS